ncbi:MAG: hypothetical protein JXB47_07430 [Anaerolineae bacterium]|nr:hypothetical protein [Anaerolineae bacterium]
MTLAQQIMEQVQRLDSEQQRRVLEFVRSLAVSRAATMDWWQSVETLQIELRAKYGEDFTFDSQTTLDEIREERLNDLMGGC